ncbi:FHA domain-containing protein [Iningainema tapete]|uniref:FHA domain-containing protein n=1 Tax=Iningainema tapete BLCC-T55 TaxID=2748662 RepID=A0A8J6XGY9_9CYAN|nr:FHA domain-containing protein [Iningainema tapete]MBD2773080.1 FHA domain-containing protein [Iningainema tapete BLCC-T55]
MNWEQIYDGGCFGCDQIPGIAQFKPETTYLLVLNGSLGNDSFSLNRLRSLIGRSHSPHITVDIDLSTNELSVSATISRHHTVIQWANKRIILSSHFVKLADFGLQTA